MRFTKLAVFGMGAVIAFGACSGAASPGASGGGGIAGKIGIELPITGGEAPNGVSTADGGQLAGQDIPGAGLTGTISPPGERGQGKRERTPGGAHKLPPAQ